MRVAGRDGRMVEEGKKLREDSGSGSEEGRRAGRGYGGGVGEDRVEGGSLAFHISN